MNIVNIGSPNLNQERCVALQRHWLAVLRGETTATAPAEYVAGLFDGYAERVGRGKTWG